MKTILVIDDEPQMRRNIASFLKLEGFRVVEAHNGRTALEVARSNRPDLILCDINMPDMDGFAVLQALRAESWMSVVPFIFLTARGEVADIRAGMNLGADDYLPKPFTVGDLLAAIEARLLRVQSLQHPSTLSFTSAQPLEVLGLTPREAEVLLWIAQGKTNAEISLILEATVGTVKKHAQHIFEKLGVDNRSSAMLVALETLGTRHPRHQASS